MPTTPNPNECYEPTDSLWVKVFCEICVCTRDPQPDQCYEKNRLYPKQGYAVTQSLPSLLLVATDCITGIECPKLWQGSTPHYWDLAWNEVAKKYFPKKDQDRIGMAMNAKYDHNDQFIRQANQLHIHVSCIQKQVQTTLDDDKHGSDIAQKPDEWKTKALSLGPNSHVYRVLRLDTEDALAKNNLFWLLWNYVVEKKDPDMQYQTLVVAKRSRGGFYILNSQSNMSNGTGAGEKDLLDESCS